MTCRRRSIAQITLLALIVFLLVVPAAAAPATPAPAAPAPAQPGGIAAAWDRARDSGSYRMQAEVEQTLVPRGTPGQAGQTDQRYVFRLEGAVRLPGQAALTLRAESGATRSQAVSLILSDGQTFVYKDGQLREASNPLGAGVAGDYLDFLASAANEHVLATREIAGELFTVYAFDVDGTRYGRFLADALSRQYGKPLQPSAAVERLTGTGELWVDGAGLPRREVLYLHLPQASDGYDADIHVTADLRDFGGVAALSRPVPDGAGGWRLEEPPAPAPPSSSGDSLAGSISNFSAATLRGAQIDPRLFVLLFALVFSAVLIAPRRGFARKLYATIAWVLIISMVSGPVLDGLGYQYTVTRAAEASAALVNPLAEALGVPDASDPSDTSARAAYAAAAEQVRQSAAPLGDLSSCGDGKIGEDADGDGLSDVVELCLGTNRYSVDTDLDGITDTLEVQGFEWPAGTGKKWYGDPFEPDTNRDGRADISEWPGPAGLAASGDLDGDGTPDLWDDDDDGDQVYDSQDLSPEVSSAYTDTFSLHTVDSSQDAYEYIEVQVQPQDSSHWRYTMSPLDWPEDEVGQMADMDGSVADITLVPVLEVQTNVEPTEELAAHYGIINAGSMYVPLFPQENGGRIASFYGKVVYAPAQTSDIDWSSARFLWMVQAKVDSYQPCYYTGCNPVAIDTQILFSYQENFRTTGLRVTRSNNIEVAALGVPSMPTEDQQLFKLAIGLNSSFLLVNTLDTQVTGQTALQAIFDRLDAPLSTRTLTYTWGVTATVAHSRAIYTHADEAIALTGSGLVQGFLNTNYPDSAYNGTLCTDASGTQFPCATILLATEQRSGAFDLSQAGTAPAALNQLEVNLTDVPVATQRSLSLHMYERHGNNPWETVTTARMLEIVNARYMDRFDSIYAAVYARYPAVIPDDVPAALYLMYMTWSAGSTNTLAVNGLALEPDLNEASMAQASMTIFHVVASDAIGVILNAVGEIVQWDMGMGLLKDWGLDLNSGNFSFTIKGHKFSSSAGKIVLGVELALGGVIMTAQIIMAALTIACSTDDDPAKWCENEHAFLVANEVFGWLSITNATISLVRSFVALAKDHSKWFTNFNAAGVVVASIGLVIDLISIWVVFGLTVAHNTGNGQVVGNAVALAVVSTVWAVVMFVLNILQPVGSIIALILQIIDLLIQVIGMIFGKNLNLVMLITQLFYSTKTTTAVDSDNVGFDGMEAGLADEARGPTVGNAFEGQDHFYAKIIMADSSHVDKYTEDLEDSYGQATFALTYTPGAGAGTVWNTDVTCDIHDSLGADSYAECSNDLGFTFTMSRAQPNVTLELSRTIRTVTVWRGCSLGGSTCADWRVHEETNDVVIPDPEDSSAQPEIYYLDVLPSSTAGLFNMYGGVIVHDADGDGVDKELDWVDLNGNDVMDSGEDRDNDWDSDDDSLSDGFERAIGGYASNPLTSGLNWLSGDTDGDTLPDRAEIVYGTDATNPDTDGDGLTDGAELYHKNVDGTWSGGLIVVTPPNDTGFGPAATSQYLIFGDPLAVPAVDADLDGLPDGLEAAKGGSPRAYNRDVVLSVDGQPLAGDPAEGIDLYTTSGRTVTFTLSLRNPTVVPVDGILDLCVPAAAGLTGISIQPMLGDRQAPRLPDGTCTDSSTLYRWNFAGAPTLQTFEAVSLTLTAQVPATSVSQGVVLTATQNWTGGAEPRVVTATRRMIIDNDAPSVTIVQPISGTLTNAHTVVIGGVAEDPTSPWLARVEVNMNDGTGWHTADGTLQWAYAWAPLADGTYTVSARAVDPFGHTSAEKQILVLVDQTPPDVTFAQTAQYMSAVTGTFHLYGPASDNFSGLAHLAVRVDEKDWRSVSFATGNWTLDWPAGNPEAQGRRDFALVAYDRAGNTTVQSAYAVIDRRPPSSNLLDRQYAEGVYVQVRAGQPVTLSGYTNDDGYLPLPSRPADLSGSLDAVSDATTWLEPASTLDDNSGTTLAWLGDVDGDRLDDLAVGMPAMAGGAGRVTLVYGKGGDWAVPLSAEQLANSATAYAGTAASPAGRIVAPLGDVNGDGFDDFALADPGHGTVALVWGRPLPSGPVDVFSDEFTRRRLGTILSLPDLFGDAQATEVRAVAAAGDVNDDGYDDVLVAVRDAGTTSGHHVGLILGHAGLWDTSHGLNIPALDAAGTTNLGLPLGVGDVNGDGYGDFVVSNPTGGQVYLYAGRAGGFEDATLLQSVSSDPGGALAAFAGTSAGERMAALGDVNGDGLADFLYSSGATANLVLGRTEGTWAVNHALSGYTATSTPALVAPGDVNRDGQSDLALVDATAHTAYLLMGSTAITYTGTPYLPVQATINNVTALAAVAPGAGGDANSDGADDLLVVPYSTSGMLGDRPEFARFDLTPYINQAALPVSGGAAAAGAPMGPQAPAVAYLYVDDDYCATCANDGHTWNVDAFSRIQNAADRATTGTVIKVMPGLYYTFALYTSGVTVEGVSADTVFVNGSGGAYVVDIAANTITLQGLTLRYAQTLVRVQQGSNSAPHVLSDLVMYSFGQAAVDVCRDTCQLRISNSTIAEGDSASAVYLKVGEMPASAETWRTVTDVPGSLGIGGGLVGASASNRLFAVQGGGQTGFYEYNLGAGTWSAGPAIPSWVKGSSAIGYVPGPVASNDILYALLSDTLGKGMPDVVYGTVYAVAQDVNGNVYIGGAFQFVSGGDEYTNIAMWNGSTWDDLGGGVNGPVYALEALGDTMYVGGNFTAYRNLDYQPGWADSSGSIVQARWGHIAPLQPSDSVGIPGGVDGAVYALHAATDANGHLVLTAGGAISTSHNMGNIAVPKFAQLRWGTLIGITEYWWWPLGPGTWNGDVHSLAVAANGDMYVGGDFTTASGVPANRLARRLADGTWLGPGNGPTCASGTCVVNALLLNGTDLYLGGLFSNVGGFQANNIARWSTSTNTWSAVGTGTNGEVRALALERVTDHLYVGGLFTAAGGVADTAYLAQWTGSAWQTTGTALAGTEGTTAVYALDRSTSAGMLVAGEFNTVSGMPQRKVALLARGVYYRLSTNAWIDVSLPVSAPQVFGAGAAIVPDPTTPGAFFVLRGGGPQFYRVTSSGSVYTALAPVPTDWLTMGDGSTAMTSDGARYLYLLGGAHLRLFFRYDTQSGTWETLPSAPYDVSGGVSLAYANNGFVYALAGQGSARFMRYHVGMRVWETLPDISQTGGVGYGGSLVRLSNYPNRLYATYGGGTPTFRYLDNVGVNQHRLELDHTLFVPVPYGTSTWTNLPLPATGDLEIVDVGGGSAWLTMGGSNPWTPATRRSADSSSALTATPYSQASFYDAVHAIYRVKSDSQIAAGYSRPHADAHVSPGYCATCTNDGYVWGVTAFSSLQAALNSGAINVYAGPGTYQEPIYLPNAAHLFGAGADRTVLEPAPGTTPATLVRAENTRDNTLAALTIAGNAGRTGVLFENGATAATVERSILRDNGTAVKYTGFAGSGYRIDLVNNTLDANGTGVYAECATYDLRNTIFTGHTLTALDLVTCTGMTGLHTYNLYFGNAHDLRVDGTPVNEPGSGELFTYPYFANPVLHDYHLLAGSPAIDAGAPGDPIPLGAGARVDMGYAEYAVADFYVDDDYCANCANDGLAWMATAFDTIGGALAAAASQLSILRPDNPALRFTISVAPGTYAEDLEVGSYVSVIGADAKTVILTGGGGSSLVRFSGAVDSALSGFTIQGSSAARGIFATGASRAISITGNLILSSGTGVLFDGGSTGYTAFNTFAGNATGALASGAGSWFYAQDSIVYGSSTYGLRAASGGSIFSDRNIVYSTAGTAYSGVAAGRLDLQQNPLFAAGGYALQETSPALDSAAGGKDRGAVQMRPLPVTLLFGELGLSSIVAHAGTQSVQAGLGAVLTPTLPLTATLPGSWTSATLTTPEQTGSYWKATLTPGADGRYRIYSRAGDALNTQEDDVQNWYEGDLYADGVAPALTLTSPANGAAVAGAAAELVATANDWLVTPLGRTFTVDRVYFRVNGVDVPATASALLWNPHGGTARTYHAWYPLPTVGASYTLQAFAVDRVGNVASTATRTFSAAGPVDAVTLTSHEHGEAVATGTPTAAGWARFQCASSCAGAHYFVDVTVDGATQQSVALPGTSGHVQWSVTITLAEGTHAVNTVLRFVPGTQQGTQPVKGEPRAPLSAISIIYDHTRPTATFTTPAAGVVSTRTLTLGGSAADVHSSVATVEVSFDGGITWSPAALAGGAWSLTVTMPENTPYVTYPVWVRATDAAGNRSAVATGSVLVDDVPPAGITPLQFSAPEGTHFDILPTLVFTWTAPRDANPSITQLVLVDQNPAAQPATAVTGNSYSAALNSTGTWYVHLAARDSAGNTTYLDFGPWYVGNFDSAASCGDKTQTIQLDGQIDVAHHEWLFAREQLDDDERGTPTQELYATWSASALYLGWQGARWPADGRLYAYLDTTAGGISEPIGLPGYTLPFAAEYAIQVDSPISGTLWHYSGTWHAESALQFAAGPEGGTEVRVPWALPGLSTVNMLAFALDRNAQPWSVFPTSNPLAGPWTEKYSWTNLCAVTSPNAGQPKGKSIDVAVASRESTLTPLGPMAFIHYEIDVTSHEALAQTGMRLRLDATSGLTYSGIEGATVVDCPSGGSSCTMSFDTLNPGAARHVTVWAQLAGELGTVSAVTTTFTLGQSSPAVAYLTEQMSHRADGQGPDIDLRLNSAGTIRPGVQTIYGTASDGDGIGVSSVSVIVGNGVPVQAAGTLNWQISVDIPNVPAPSITVRAWDLNANQSQRQFTFERDDRAPSVSLTPPSVLTGTVGVLAGSGSDTSESHTPLVESVELQFSGETTWRSASGIEPAGAGNFNWDYNWVLPDADGALYPLRLRVTDLAGNVTTGSFPSPYQVLVDTRAPVITVTHALAAADGGPYPPSATPILSGTVTDGSGVATVSIRVDAPDGVSVRVPATLAGNDWYYRPTELPLSGLYRLYVIARDIYGNESITGRYELNVTAVPIAGLALASDSPRELHQSATLTATVTAGTNITYTWDFGDGSAQVVTTARVVTHRYSSWATYTAGVTARNSLGSSQATTSIVVDEAPAGLAATNDSPKAVGASVSFTATLSAGSRLTYAWNFGDGTTGSTATPAHAYTASGTYTATITVTNSVGQAIAATIVRIDDSVTGLAATSSSPTALGSTTRFTATLAGGSNVAYAWAFGDGAAGSGATITHTYATAGTYTAVVTGTNSVSQQSTTTSVQVVVPLSGLSASSSSPTALGSASHFTATLAAGGGTITYAWAFGDGTTGSGANPVHTYSAPDIYTATVTATNSVSQVSATTAVHVRDAVAGLTATSSSPTALGQATAFTATLASGHGPVIYGWVFGDGATAAGANTTHTYAAPGTYTAAVTADNGVSQMTVTTTVAVDVPIGPLLHEGFDGALYPPAGWAAGGTAGSQPWQRTSAQAHSAPYSVYHNDDAGAQDAWLITPRITPTEASALLFWQYENYNTSYTYHGIWVSAGSPDPNDGDFVEVAALGPGVEDSWTAVQVALDAYVGRPIYLAFRYQGNNSDEWYVDDVTVTAPLVASSDSPTYLSLPTTLTATVPVGTNVVYTWAFGDGAAGTGAHPVHTYPAAGTYTATVTATNSLGFVASTTRITILPAVDVELTKLGPANVPAGSALTYTLQIHNLGPSDASQLVVVDTLPAVLSFVSAPPGCNHAGGVVTCTLSLLAAGDTTSLEIAAHSDPAARGTITNTAQVAAAEHELDADDNGAAVSTLLGVAVDLEVEMAATPQPAIAGETLTYTLQATNAGPSTDGHAVLSATVPAGTTFVSITPGCVRAGDTITCTLGSLSPGVIQRYALVVSVAPEARGMLVAQAGIAGEEPEVDPADNHAVVTTAIAGQVDLAVTLDAVPDPVAAGEWLTYTLGAGNAGPSQATGVILSGTLPASTTLVLASPGCTESAGVVTCALPPLAPGANAAAGVVVAVDPLARGTLTFTVTAASVETERDPADNQASRVVALAALADLALALDYTPDPVTAGEELTYTVTLSNGGPSASDGAVVTGTLPAGASFVDASAGCTHTGGVITCTMSTLMPGGQALADLRVAVAPEMRGALTYTMHATGLLPDPQLANNSATATAELTALADLALTLSAPPVVVAGQTFTYTVVVTNTGPSQATGLTFTQQLPQEITFVPAVPGCTATGGVITCLLGELAPGGNAARDLVVAVEPAATGILTSTAGLQGIEPDPQPANNQAAVAVDVETPTDLAVSLSSAPDPVVAGRLLTYTVIVSDLGPARATQIVLSDVLPAGTSFVRASPNCTELSGQVTCTAPSLPPGSQLTFVIVVRVDAATPGPVTNTVRVSNAQPDPYGGNNTATTVTQKVFVACLPLMSYNRQGDRKGR